MFIDEFRSPMSRTVKLDKKIINKLLRFLLKEKTPQGPPTNSKSAVAQQHTSIENSKMEALLWLRDFLKFFQDDFL